MRGVSDINKKPLKPCSYPGCPKLSRTRYCEEHTGTRTSQPRNARKMGYDSRWEKYRKDFLMRNPLCVECLKQGKHTPATVVDHIVPHKGSRSLFWNEKNHQSLCVPCHNKKTANEDMGWWDTSKGLQ